MFSLEACLLLLEFPIRFTGETVALTDVCWESLSAFYLLSVNLPAVKLVLEISIFPTVIYFILFYFLTSLLEYNCFTMVC